MANSKKKSKEKKLKGIELTAKEQAELSAPRNPIIRAEVESGGRTSAGAHKDKKFEEKNGKEKHKKKNYGY